MARVLVLTPQLPYPPEQGTSLRNFHIIRGLAERHEVSLLSFREADQRDDAAAIAPLLQYCRTIITVPAPVRSQAQRLAQLLTTRQPDMAHRLASPAFDEQLHRLLERNDFDVVQIEGLELARAMSIIRIVSSRSRIVFDDHNAESELQRRSLTADLTEPSRWPAAAYSWIQVRRLQRFEAWACHQADWITAVSEADRDHLYALDGDLQTPISVIPNCIDVLEYETDPLFSDGSDNVSVRNTGESLASDLIFSGKMDYRPNVDAVLWFADNVWPLIRRRRPAASWVIVGQRPHPRLARLRSVAGVTVTGRVESVKPYLAEARVYIMPFRVGSGTRLKLIEAMAAGRAIVSTPIGVEGFPVQHERQVLLAHSPDEMAAAVLHLLDHPEVRRRLGEAGRRFARRYDWRQVIPAFDGIYQQLLGQAALPLKRS